MAKPVHRKHARSFVIGTIAIIVAGVAIMVGLRPLFGGELTGLPYTYVTAAFDDVGTLDTKRDVRENSVPIGKVSKIEYRNGKALVTLRIDGHVPVYGDATASVQDESALAQKFVDIRRGSPTAGPLGNRPINSGRNRNATNLDDVLNIFDPQTRDSLQRSVQQLGGGLGGHGQDLNDVLRVARPGIDDLGTVSRALSSRTADLPGLLSSADRLTGHLDNHDRQITSLLGRSEQTLRAVNTDDTKPLRQTLQGLPSTLRHARGALDALNQPLRDAQSAVSTVRPGGQALGRSAPDLRAVLRDAVPPLDQIPGVADSAKPAVDDLRQTLADARPVVPQVSETVKQADTLLSGVAPYSKDVGDFFGQKDLLAGTLAPDRHYFAIQVVFPGLHVASLPDPTVQRDPYPAPGKAAPSGEEPTRGDP